MGANDAGRRFLAIGGTFSRQYGLPGLKQKRVSDIKKPHVVHPGNILLILFFHSWMTDGKIATPSSKNALGTKTTGLEDLCAYSCEEGGFANHAIKGF